MRVALFSWATRSSSDCRNKELDELWPKVNNLEAEVAHLKEHTEQLMGQLALAEARILVAERQLHRAGLQVAS